jgi:hypothetical protein
VAERGRTSARAPKKTQFLGPPGRLRLAGGDAGAVASVKALHLPEALRGYADDRHPVLRRGRDPGRTRLRLPAHTPPGHYEGQVELADGQSQPFELTIEPRPRIRVSPSTLNLAGAAGAKVQAKLLLENRGNVPIDIDETLVTGVFDNDGIETALASAYRLETDDLNQIVATVFGRLRDAHGGLLKLRVAEGAGVLAVGARRMVALETVLGSKLRAGHGYHGVLNLGGHAIAVRLSVAPASARNPSGAK